MHLDGKRSGYISTRTIASSCSLHQNGQKGLLFLTGFSNRNVTSFVTPTKRSAKEHHRRSFQPLLLQESEHLDSIDGSDGADHFSNIITTARVLPVVVNDNKASSAIGSNMDFEHSRGSTSHHQFACDVRGKIDARNVGGYCMADRDVTSDVSVPAS